MQTHFLLVDATTIQTNVGEYNPSNNARVSMYVFSNDGINFDIFILEKV